jgi:hypothetical protein
MVLIQRQHSTQLLRRAAALIGRLAQPAELVFAEAAGHVVAAAVLLDVVATLGTLLALPAVGGLPLLDTLIRLRAGLASAEGNQIRGVLFVTQRTKCQIARLASRFVFVTFGDRRDTTTTWRRTPNLGRICGHLRILVELVVLLNKNTRVRLFGDEGQDISTRQLVGAISMTITFDAPIAKDLGLRDLALDKRNQTSLADRRGWAMRGRFANLIKANGTKHRGVREDSRQRELNENERQRNEMGPELGAISFLLLSNFRYSSHGLGVCHT